MTEVKTKLNLSEPLIFSRSASGCTAIDWSHITAEESLVGMSDEEAYKQALGVHFNELNQSLLPQVSEPSAVRHFTRLSQLNFSIDTNSYPLGSCTMKYNPKINEWASRLPALSSLHPYMEKSDLQNAFKIAFELQNYLQEIGGFAQVSLAPSAGAHGEFAGIAMIHKALKAKGETRKTILVPKSAHGTNPATAAFFSYDVVSLNIGEDGRIILAEVEKLMDENCAGIMITNPNTLGIFESDILSITKLVHERGGYVYGDGANLNALMGITRPGDWGVDVMHFNLHKTMTTPHGGGGPGCGALGASPSLAEFLPGPIFYKNDQGYEDDFPKNSIGRIRSFYSNFGMIIRAWTYIRSLGPDGLRQASQYAVLNANYLKEKLKAHYHLPYETDCLHEVVFSDKKQSEFGISALDIAKRLIDYDVHPPTIYFPLLVKGALMIEPTETEALHDLEAMIDALTAVAKDAKTDPNLVKTAPHSTKLNRLDEAMAARKPVLNYLQILD